LLSPISGRVNVWRAEAATLEAALGDLKPGLGAELARRRGSTDRKLQPLLEPSELSGALRRKLGERLSGESTRYSLLIRTSLGADTRQRHVVCTADESPRILIDWEVAR
jgi:hypothetical protein